MVDLIRGTLAHCLASPFEDDRALELIEDGALALEDGKILAAGAFSELSGAFPGAKKFDERGKWLIPGFVDGHVHFPQHYATAAYGRDLLDWLDNSIFPSEALLREQALAESVARDFVERLLAAGTTTALVFGSQFEAANLALFREAEKQGLRLIAGMTMMDRGAPEVLLQSPDQAEGQCRRLLAEIAGKPRLHYALTPRFALSCSSELLTRCGELAREFNCRVQTHINENLHEIELTLQAFPKAKNYLDVYDHFELLSPRTMLAHGIHTKTDEFRRWSESGAAVCHCPSSNLYLGSGLMPLSRYLEAHIPLSMGSDIGAGTSVSIPAQVAQAYEINQLRRNGMRNPGEIQGVGESLQLNAARLLYLGTLSGARALGLDHETGNFEPGKAADVVLLNPTRDYYLRERLRRCESLTDQLFVLLHQTGPAQIERLPPQFRGSSQLSMIGS